ncbi:hypothetical protein AJ80_07171 [Polytolypa hystricis UAMH7299]|uniref:chitinase n=2 Tax=Polytolypa hystricis (strain UAMH7299) TaxID=1447883 RepID=A0A2B7XQY7_POLH7|nr:hypothetical protein AJ80_07171 [Polytolypa hystricis UAMH7299]
MATTYTIQPGDTMWAIANAHNVALDALIAANPQIPDPGMIQVGQEINLPSGGAAPAPAPPAPEQPEQPPGTAPPTTAPLEPSRPVPEPAPGSRGLKTVGYFTNWGIYGRKYQPLDIPADHITHILYSFANVRPESGEVYLSDTYADLEKHYPGDSWDEPGNENAYGCVKQLFLLKQRYRHLKVLLSIGGWTYSSNFAAPAATPSGRQTFANTAVQLLADLGFDGIDIDWEYPQDDEQAQNYVLLLDEMRRALDAHSAQHLGGKRLLLTIAAPCGANHYSKLHMADMDRSLDFWNLMCYDFAGSWDSTAGHQANVYASPQYPAATPFSADAAISAYIAGGVEPKKLIFGLPLYGRAFENTAGPGAPFQGVGEGSFENGIWDYKVLPQAGAQEYHDHHILASWSYEPQVGKMVSYDTPDMARRKVEYILARGLGGGMWWELSGDHPVENPRSLVRTTVEGFGGTGHLDHTENVLEFPTSKYENLKNGFPNK